MRADVEVERALGERIGRVGSAGREGEFKDLEALGRSTVVPVLIRMLNGPAYKFVLAYRHEKPYWYPGILRQLAVSALGTLGGEGAREAVAAFAGKAQQGNQLRLEDAIALAQFRLGDRKPLEDRVLQLRQLADAALKSTRPGKDMETCLLLSSLVMLLERAGRPNDAAPVSRELLEILDRDLASEDPSAEVLAGGAYNLSCFYAIAGNRPKAVALLGKAVRTGFVDRGWIQADEDLDSIRSDEGYKKLISDDVLFEKRERDD